MRSLIRALCNKSKSNHRNLDNRRSSSRQFLGLETLEDRVLMDGSGTLSWKGYCNVIVNPSEKTAIIDGSEYSDQVMVQYGFQYGLVNIQCGNGQHIPWYFQPDEVNKIVFQGRGGNDVFTNTTGLRSEAYGGSGNDTLIGGYGTDELHGGYGGDELKGNGTSFGTSFGDSLHGDSGNDTLYGSNSNDTLFGGPDHDELHGGVGNDELVGGSGNDTLYGGTGNDTLTGNSGLDELYGELGDDHLEGGYDKVVDQLTGGPGSDTFVNEYRRWTWGGWQIEELDHVNDQGFGDTLKWKSIHVRYKLPI